MAKKRKIKSKAAHEEPVPHRKEEGSKDVEQGLARLRTYYSEGRESLKSNPERVPYGSSSEFLRKARVFASRFTEAEFDELEALCRQHKTAFGRSLIDRLATIHDRTARKELLEQAIRGRWSKIKVDREIRLRFGRRRKLGRNPHKPASVDEALSEIVRITVKLTRYGESLGWNAETGRIELQEEPDVASQLPNKVISELKKTLRAAWRLQDIAEVELRKRR